MCEKVVSNGEEEELYQKKKKKNEREDRLQAIAVLDSAAFPPRVPTTIEGSKESRFFLLPYTRDKYAASLTQHKST